MKCFFLCWRQCNHSSWFDGDLLHEYEQKQDLVNFGFLWIWFIFSINQFECDLILLHHILNCLNAKNRYNKAILLNSDIEYDSLNEMLLEYIHICVDAKFCQIED